MAEWLTTYESISDSLAMRGRDFILRKAPHLIVATAPENLPMGRDNARFSLAYAELFAPSLGLGTCWAGFVEMCAGAGHGPLLELFNLPDNRRVAGVIMAGYPQYSYRRLPERAPLQVEWR